MNDHREFALISAYLDGELSPEEWARVNAHLASCALCGQDLAALRSAKQRASAAPRRAAPAQLLSRLRQIPPAEPSGRFPLWLMRPQVWLPAGSLAAALFLGLWFGTRAPEPQEFLPLEPLLAAHSRYSAETLVPQSDPVSSDFSARLASYSED